MRKIIRNPAQIYPKKIEMPRRTADLELPILRNQLNLGPSLNFLEKIRIITKREKFYFQKVRAIKIITWVFARVQLLLDL